MEGPHLLIVKAGDAPLTISLSCPGASANLDSGELWSYFVVIDPEAPVIFVAGHFVLGALDIGTATDLGTSYDSKHHVSQYEEFHFKK